MIFLVFSSSYKQFCHNIWNPSFGDLELSHSLSVQTFSTTHGVTITFSSLKTVLTLSLEFYAEGFIIYFEEMAHLAFSLHIGKTVFQIKDAFEVCTWY